MKISLAKSAAAVVLAVAATLSFPIAASAYPSNADAVVTPVTTAPGGTVTFSVLPDSFDPGEDVTVTITGENASAATLAIVLAAVQTKTLGTFDANAAGGLDSIRVALPANASGNYTIAAFADSVPSGISTTVSISAAGSGGSGLPATGLDSNSLLGLWVGGGALVLAGGAVAVAAAVRRQRVHADA